jgi:hypothetical protein
MSQPTVIELGEVGRPAAQPEPGRPGWSGLRRHRALAAAVGVALLLGVAGAAPTTDPLLQATVPMGTGEVAEVDGDRLYVLARSRTSDTDGVRRIRAYRLPGGTPLWEAGVPVEDGDFAVVTTMRGVLLTARYEPTEGGIGELIALDVATGAPRWRRTGSLFGTAEPASGRLLVAEDDPGSGEVGRLVAVDVETGAVAWTYRPPPGAALRGTWRTRPGPAYLVTALPSGRVEVRGMADGRLRAVGSAGGAVPAGADPGYDWMSIIDDLLMVQGPRPGMFTAYGLPRLDRRWRVTVRDGQFGWYGPGCGRLLCLQTGDQEMRAVEPRTGRTRWTAGWTYVEPTGGLMVASRSLGPYGSATPLWLVDPATGREVGDLGRWGLAARRSQDEDLVLVAPDPARHLAWFGVVDPGLRGVAVRGVATGVIGECWAATGALVCRRDNESVGIWRYR